MYTMRVIVCLSLFCVVVSYTLHSLINRKFIDDYTECKCVPFHLCADNDILVNGIGLIDVRFTGRRCHNYFEVCCKSSTDMIRKFPKDKPTVEECGYKKSITSQNVSHSLSSRINQSPPSQYLLSQDKISTRITSDSTITTFGEMPWSALILLREMTKTGRSIYKCGGSLIHPEVILTAAHCVIDVENLYLIVRIGEWNTKSLDEPVPHQDVGVKEIVIHELFDSGSLRNDIALLFLESSVVLAENIGLICLPPPDIKLEPITCVASGWGKDAFKMGKHSSIMKKVNLPLIGRESCIRALRETRLGASYKLDESFICAGGVKGQDTCKGDGGSALVCPIPDNNEIYFQMGIVSWGIGCGADGTPGVYTNVPLFSNWVDKQLIARAMNVNIYK